MSVLSLTYTRSTWQSASCTRVARVRNRARESVARGRYVPHDTHLNTSRFHSRPRKAEQHAIRRQQLKRKLSASATGKLDYLFWQPSFLNFKFPRQSWMPSLRLRRAVSSSKSMVALLLLAAAAPSAPPTFLLRISSSPHPHALALPSPNFAISSRGAEIAAS
jgi:hypothetical protein